LLGIFMTDRALFVGINAYPTQPLLGCVNDIIDAAQFLTEKFGFQDANMWHLTDADATADAIKEKIRDWLIGQATAGDRLFFFYSGHGTILNYSDGKIHDVICPVDFNFTNLNGISDLDFAQLFSAIPQNVQFNWVSDSCHSGGLAAAHATEPEALAPRRPKFLVPPPSVAEAIQQIEMAGGQRSALISSAQGLNGALIAACRSDQLSFDSSFNGRPNGVLTHYLLAELASPAGLSESLRDAVAHTSSAVVQAGWPQITQLRGDSTTCDGPVLGGVPVS
jgi:metacaspase-1